MAQNQQRQAGRGAEDRRRRVTKERPRLAPSWARGLLEASLAQARAQRQGRQKEADQSGLLPLPSSAVTDTGPSGPDHPSQPHVDHTQEQIRRKLDSPLPPATPPVNSARNACIRASLNPSQSNRQVGSSPGTGSNSGGSGRKRAHQVRKPPEVFKFQEKGTAPDRDPPSQELGHGSPSGSARSSLGAVIKQGALETALKSAEKVLAELGYSVLEGPVPLPPSATKKLQESPAKLVPMLISCNSPTTGPASPSTPELRPPLHLHMPRTSQTRPSSLKPTKSSSPEDSTSFESLPDLGYTPSTGSPATTSRSAPISPVPFKEFDDELPLKSKAYDKDEDAAPVERQTSASHHQSLTFQKSSEAGTASLDLLHQLLAAPIGQATIQAGQSSQGGVAFLVIPASVQDGGDVLSVTPTLLPVRPSLDGGSVVQIPIAASPPGSSKSSAITKGSSQGEGAPSEWQESGSSGGQNDLTQAEGNFQKEEVEPTAFERELARREAHGPELPDLVEETGQVAAQLMAASHNKQAALAQKDRELRTMVDQMAVLETALTDLQEENLELQKDQHLAGKVFEEYYQMLVGVGLQGEADSVLKKVASNASFSSEAADSDSADEMTA